MKPTVYLAGPIAGLTYGNAIDWRTQAELQLSPDIVCFSPLRGEGSTYKDDEKIDENALPKDAILTDSGITSRDRFDVNHRDVVIMNLLGAEEVSKGSMIELGWADYSRTPVVLVMEEGNIHDHPMVRSCASYIVTTLEDATRVVRILLLPNYVRK